MAPEVGAGKYDRSIDIYAMGAVLYEMLTGTVPFIGASPSEVLMKHLQAEPDCTGIPEPFCTVIRKAMAKDPAKAIANGAGNGRGGFRRGAYPAERFGFFAG